MGHTSDAAVESSHLTGVRRRVSSGSSSSFENDATSTKTFCPSFVSKKAVLPQHHGWNRSRVGRHSQRIWDIQNRRHIRAPQREEVTDDGTDYEVRARERASREPSRKDAGSDHGVGVLHGLKKERCE